jgi:hypothetical protein
MASKATTAAGLPPRIPPPGAAKTAGVRPNLAGYVGQHVVLVSAQGEVTERETRKGETVEQADSSVTIYNGTTTETVSGLDSLRLARQIQKLNTAGLLPTVVRVVKHGRGSSTAFAPWEDESESGPLWAAYLGSEVGA